MLGDNNKQISSILNLPLSTTQRRTIHLIQNGFVISTTRLNHEKFGFKSGLLHVYLNNGNVEEIAKRISQLDKVTSVEIHIGNSDILGNVVYKDGTDLLETISRVKELPGIARMDWSERIYTIPSEDKDNNLVNLVLKKRH